MHLMLLDAELPLLTDIMIHSNMVYIGIAGMCVLWALFAAYHRGRAVVYSLCCCSLLPVVLFALYMVAMYLPVFAAGVD